MFDEEHPDLERDPANNDENPYSLSSISDLNVVIVCLHAGLISNNLAVAVTTKMRASFEVIRFGLMVCMGGEGLSAEADVRLRDVVDIKPYTMLAGMQSLGLELGFTTPSKKTLWQVCINSWLSRVL
jgi:hypothetical protein